MVLRKELVMGCVEVRYRKKGGFVSGSVIAGNETDRKVVVDILEKFLLRWCGRHCFAEHGFPIFTLVPFSVKGRRITCRLPAALRRAGLAVRLVHVVGS